jgi:hypothetical protein
MKQNPAHGKPNPAVQRSRGDRTLSRAANELGRIPVLTPTPPRLQTWLGVNHPADTLEQEADRAAERVIRNGEPRQSCPCGGGCPRCRAEREAGELRRPQASSTREIEPGEPRAPAVVDEVLRSPGQPLNEPARVFMEPRFEYDFSRVRVHTDTAASESADAVSARAYTYGQHIVFAAGQYHPGSPAGRRLLAHELAHTIQQGIAAAADESSAAPAGSISRQGTTNPSSPAGGEQPVYVCTKPILGSTLHRQGHAFFRVGGSTPGHPTYELEHARSCYCGWQGWPRRDVPEDRDADVPCVLTPINNATLAANWNTYPVGQYCARGPNSNTYVRVMSAMCGSRVRPPGNIAGYDASPPAAGGAGAPHPFLSVVTCWSVDCDDTECGLIPGINSDIVPGRDPEALNAPGEASEPAVVGESDAADEEEAIA